MSTEQQWSFSKFFLNLRNPDSDYHIFAFQDLEEYLQKLTIFEPDSVPTINGIFLPNVVQKITEKEAEIVNHAFRTIVLLAQTLPNECIDKLFTEIFEQVYDVACEVRTQVLAILREILTNSISYDQSRQIAISESIYPRLNREIGPSKDDVLLFNIGLFIALVESLGFTLSQDQLSELLDHIKKYSETDSQETLQAIADLCKYWALYANEDLLDQLMTFLFETLEDRKNAFFILTTMSRFRAQVYTKYAAKLIQLFIDQVENEEADVAQLLEENEDLDITAESNYIPNVSDLLESLSCLTLAFPEVAKEKLEYLSNFVFRYLIYNSSVANVEMDDDIPQDEDNDFEIDGEEMPDDDEEGSEPIFNGDESWKLRKAALTLAGSLLQIAPEEFFNDLIVCEEEEDHIGMLNVIIQDFDIGVQKDALGFIKQIIHTYKGKPEISENIKLWIGTCVAQLKLDRALVLPKLLSTLSFFIKEQCAISEANILNAITAISTKVSEPVVPAILEFLVSSLRVSKSINDLVPLTCQIFEQILKQSKDKTTIPCLSAISRFYALVSDPKDAAANSLDELNAKVLDLVKQKGEKMVYSIATLSIFVISAHSLKTAKASLNTIIECSSNDSAAKAAFAAITLIGLSPQSDALKPHVKVIFDNIIKIFTNVRDLQVIYRALWVLRVLLEKKFISPDNCQPAVKPLISIIFINDNRSTLLAFTVLKAMPSCSGEIILKITDVLTVNTIPEDVVFAIAEFVAACINTSRNDVETLINTLIKFAKDHSDKHDILSSIALVIGYVAGHDEKLRSVLIPQFSEKISGVIPPFSMLCLGEIGSYVDVSSNEAVINEVFSAINNSDRDIFAAAADCIGSFSAGSINFICDRMLKSATTDVTHFSTWLIAISSLVKKLYKLQIPADKLKSILDKLVDYLFANADYNKETSQLIAECFSYIFRVDNSYVLKLIPKSNDDNAAPVVHAGIALYLQTADKTTVGLLIEPIMKLIDTEKPQLSSNIILSLKSALRFPTLVPKLLPYFNETCKCVPMSPAHTITSYYGAQQITVDIGKPLRLNALDTIITYFKSSPDMIDAQQLIKAGYSSLTDQDNLVKARGLCLFSELCSSPLTVGYILDDVANIANALVDIEQLVSNTNIDTPEIDAPFKTLLVQLIKATEKQKQNDLEQMYSKYKNDEQTEKIRTELGYAINVSSSSSAESASACYELILQYREEAAVIFAK